MKRSEIVDSAKFWLGTPWHHQGRTRAGCDCIGFVIGLAREFDVEVNDQYGYGRLPNDYRLQQALLDHCAISAATAPGNVLLMRFLGYPQHVAVDCGSTFIHAYEPAGKVCEYAWTDKWRRRIVAMYVLPGTQV